MKLLVFFIGITLAMTACANPEAVKAAVEVGVQKLPPAVSQVPGAIAGNPISWVALGSYVLNAGLAAWATYERRKRKKVENAGR